MDYGPTSENHEANARTDHDGQAIGPRTDASTVWLLFGQVDSSGAARRIPIEPVPFRIGRRSNLPLCLSDPTVSNVHAEIVHDQGRLLVRDLKSTNGTFVNGIRVVGESALCENDLLQLSNVALRLLRQEANRPDGTVTGDVCDQAMGLIQFDKLIDGQAALPFFQPIVDLASRDVEGYEIVGRSRLFGLTTPREMFLAASRLDLQAELSQVFRREGIRQSLQLAGEPNLFVNTAPMELNGPNLARSLPELRAVRPTGPLTLEIHEAAVTGALFMADLRSALHDLDIQLAYDDFGSGQARLVELVEVRPDFLKFDIGLVKGVHEAPAQRQRMLATLVQMVRELGIVPLAEGVECPEDGETCRQIGFELAQGYYYGRPAEVANFAGGTP